MSAVEEFESILKELPTIKAPGVSGTRIKKLTEIAVKNVSDESNLITSLYSNCKAVPSSHKLGTLYVVDSIVRGYSEEAKKLNQTIDSSAKEGTFASGVFKISELIDSLIDDAMELLINKSQIIKISKLVDIWERAETFNSDLIEKIRDKHFKSTTPPNTPPRTSVEPIKPTSDDSDSILSVLASLAKPSSPKIEKNDNPADSILSKLSEISNQNQNQNPKSPTPPQGPNGEMIFNMLQQMQSGQVPPQKSQTEGRNPRDSNDFTSRRNRSRSPTRVGGSRFGNVGGGNYQDNYNQQPQQNQYQQSNNFNSPQQQFNQPQFGQQSQFDQRSSYEQQRQHQQHQPVQAPPQNQYGSPLPSQYGQAPPQFQSNPAFTTPMEMGGEINTPGTAHFRPRNVGFDQSIPQGSFKVLSRTLFIGGVPRSMDERQLSSVLKPFAEVQSVILNSDRKHAFVKVYSRREAEQVITSFNKDGQLPLRTRWGVGFGPRDCCNYQHGISIIPIQRLTDADKAWVVKAQWGGTGGEPLVSGIVIDEPDIEIGAGISSKAMSKKMPTNSARNGPKSNKPGEPDEDYVKTTMMGGRGGRVPDARSPDGFNNNQVNPLAGLFGNQGPPQHQQQQQFPPQQQQQQYPPQGMQYQGGMPNLPQLPNNPGFQDFMQNMQQQQGGNINMYQGPPQ